MMSNLPGSGEAEELEQVSSDTGPSDQPVTDENGVQATGPADESEQEQPASAQEGADQPAAQAAPVEAEPETENPPQQAVESPVAEGETEGEAAAMEAAPAVEAPVEAEPETENPPQQAVESPVAEGEAAATEATPAADEMADEAPAPQAAAAPPHADDYDAYDSMGAVDTHDDEPHEAETPQTMEAALATQPNVPGLRRGDLLEGTIVATSPTSVMVDIGGKTDGIIPGRELERMNRETLDMLKTGETIPVLVVNPSDHEGNTILSLNRALEELDWQKAEEYRVSQEVYESVVAGYNKGGLIVRFGRVRGFVPQSQISTERRGGMDGETPEERWGEMVNDPIAVKVMEVDRSRNRLILSERAASREVRETRKEALISDLKVGEVRTGRVVSLVDFGVFVDIGGAEGLVHLTEMSWKHVNHPRELVRVGETVRVEVISVDPNRKRIGLSMKRQEADPWDAVAINYIVGQLVQGTITKLTKFGAFARLTDAPEIEGLVHISELSEQRVNHPREVVKEGDVLTLRVVKMDIENRRLGLSLKRVNSAEYMDMDLDWD